MRAQRQQDEIRYQQQEQYIQQMKAEIAKLPPDQQAAATEKLIAEMRGFIGGWREQERSYEQQSERLEQRGYQKQQIDAEQRSAEALEKLQEEIRKYRQYQEYGVPSY